MTVSIISSLLLINLPFGLAFRLQVRETDLDILENILPSVAHGNLQKYNSRDISVQSLRRLFDVSQLTVQYLLYVQDRLAGDVRAMKVRFIRTS